MLGRSEEGTSKTSRSASCGLRTELVVAGTEFAGVDFVLGSGNFRAKSPSSREGG